MMLIVGLGNPGEEYEDTRHNLGFRVVDALCRRWGSLRLRETARHSVYARTSRGGATLVLAKPVTYMNRSGLAVAELAEKTGIVPAEILVLYDDNALPAGAIRIRKGGGSGGHKGVSSVIRDLGTEEFPRIRLGIGRTEEDAVDHVLSPFRKDEIPLVEEAVETAADAVEVLLDEGIEAAMNRYNRRLRTEEESETD